MADQEHKNAGRGSRRGPPQLKLRLASRLSWLAVFNIIPISLMGYIWWNWQAGNLSFVVDQGLLILIALLLGMAVLVGTSSFIILPIVDYGCRKAKWHFFNDSKLSWFLPLIGSHVIAFLTWVLCLALILSGLWVTGLVAIKSFAPGLLGEQEQAEPTLKPLSPPEPSTPAPME